MKISTLRLTLQRNQDPLTNSISFTIVNNRKRNKRNKISHNLELFNDLKMIDQRIKNICVIINDLRLNNE